MRSMSAAAVLGVSAAFCATAHAQWLTSGANIYYSAGNVGVGTSAPIGRFHAVTSATSNGTRAVFGHASSGSGVTYGVYGLANSPTARGVFGWATAASGINFGVVGQSASSSGHGVAGLATSTTGITYGVLGQNRASSAVIVGTPLNTPAGVFGQAISTTGRTAGVLGHAASPRGAGVAGFETSTTGPNTGVYGESRSPEGTGVAGYGLANTGSSTGVYGRTNSASQGWAVFAEGAIGASGEKLLHIDHPLDPANKYLNHFCAEGPEPLLIYRGNATLDGRGAAWVQLPDYFEALNRDFHYQLTAIGAPALVYVAGEIENNRFQIAGGQPGMKVSWTVTGARNDAFVRAYGKAVEETKTAEEAGKYLHPELYGQPADLAVRPRPAGE